MHSPHNIESWVEPGDDASVYVCVCVCVFIGYVHTLCYELEQLLIHSYSRLSDEQFEQILKGEADIEEFVPKQQQKEKELVYPINNVLCSVCM